jgi:hypothetical protein
MYHLAGTYFVINLYNNGKYYLPRQTYNIHVKNQASMKNVVDCA